MRKKSISAFLFACSALLTIGFAVRLSFDCTLHYEYGSAPLWLYLAVRSAEFMIPAIGCFVFGMLLSKKAKENGQN